MEEEEEDTGGELVHHHGGASRITLQHSLDGRSFSWCISWSSTNLSYTVHITLAKPSNGGSASLGVADQYFHNSEKMMISHGGVSEAEEDEVNMRITKLSMLSSSSLLSPPV